MVTRNDIERDLCGDAQHDAAIWRAYLKRTDLDEGVWPAFTEWLEKDDAHPLAYDEAERLDEVLDRAKDRFAPVAAVTPLRARRRVGWILAGAAAAIAASLSLILLPRDASPPSMPFYATAATETRTQTLPDGTVVDLNRSTAMTVAFTDRRRDIHLERGEVLIHVAPDPKRPLVVVAGGSEIRDIGTVFDVARSGDRLTVGVAQGRVSVAPPGGGPPHILAAGDQLAARAGEAASVSHVAPSSISSWTQGVLVYESAPFSRVVSDLNRYGDLVIVQQGADSSFAPISGILEISDQAVMLERLGHMIPLALDRSQEGRIMVRARSATK